MTNYDDLKFAVEALTGRKNTVLLDDVGMPSIMVVIPKFNSQDVLANAAQSRPHPAFIVGGVEQPYMYIGKYLSIVRNERAYSLPFETPINRINFDNSLLACRAKGAGWGLPPDALYDAIALWCKKNGTQPHGNNASGKDVSYPHEHGVLTSETDAPMRTLTGSGPATWNHDFTSAGIADLNGNVREWAGGMRWVGRQLNIIQNADSILYDCDHGADSEAWKAIMPDGSLVAPGTAGALTFDWLSDETGTRYITMATTCNTSSSSGAKLQDIKVVAGLTPPQLAYELALIPADADGYGEDYVYYPVSASAEYEYLSTRGGYWGHGEDAGVFYRSFYTRTTQHISLGFRAAFCPPAI